MWHEKNEGWWKYFGIVVSLCVQKKKERRINAGGKNGKIDIVRFLLLVSKIFPFFPLSPLLLLFPSKQLSDTSQVSRARDSCVNTENPTPHSLCGIFPKICIVSALNNLNAKIKMKLLDIQEKRNEIFLRRLERYFNFAKMNSAAKFFPEDRSRFNLHNYFWTDSGVEWSNINFQLQHCCLCHK